VKSKLMPPETLPWYVRLAVRIPLIETSKDGIFYTTERSDVDGARFRA